MIIITYEISPLLYTILKKLFHSFYEVGTSRSMSCIKHGHRRSLLVWGSLNQISRTYVLFSTIVSLRNRLGAEWKRTPSSVRGNFKSASNLNVRLMSCWQEHAFVVPQRNLGDIIAHFFSIQIIIIMASLIFNYQSQHFQHKYTVHVKIFRENCRGINF